MVESSQKWQFFEEKPDPGSVFGFPKISSLQDPRATALIERFRAQGYTLGWNREDGISARLADGREIVYDEDGRYFRITDPHSDLILIRKHG